MTKQQFVATLIAVYNSAVFVERIALEILITKERDLAFKRILYCFPA